MTNFDWTSHARGCECQSCSASGKPLVRILEHTSIGQFNGRKVVRDHEPRQTQPRRQQAQLV